MDDQVATASDWVEEQKKFLGLGGNLQELITNSGSVCTWVA